MAAQFNEEENKAKKMIVFVTVPRPLDRRGALKVVAIEVSSDDTVASVKATLHDMEGIPPHRQRLVFACSALPDDDGTTLADHGVVHSATIQLVETKMRVFVKRLDGSTITISVVESCDTVEGFRIRVQEQDGIRLQLAQQGGGIGIRPARQRLICDDSGIQMQDGHTLADYGVRDNTCMTLLVRWIVNYLHRGVDLEVDVTDTVGRIKERVQEAEGVPVECQSVVVGGKELDDRLTLTHYDVFENPTFVMIVCGRQERDAATNTTTKRKREEPVIVKETVKTRALVTSPGKKKEIPAWRWRRFTVHLYGPELAAICPSSCDPDPVY
jgi:hypothetical protein